MSLTPLQHQLFEWICGSEPIPDVGPEQVVFGGALSPGSRVGIYAEMYWLRMRDTLREDFPLVASVVGEARFEALVAAYIRVHPSRSYTLGQLGREFPAFLRTRELDDAPWLPDVAALERARTAAFVAPDSEVLKLEALAALDGDSFVHSRLRPTPALTVLTLQHDVAAMWSALQENTARPEKVDRAQTNVVVWRNGFEVFHVTVAPPEAAALQSVLAGASLPTVCEPFADEADAAAAAFRAIGSWVNEGMMAALEVDAA